jgi:hypothetical protein
MYNANSPYMPQLPNYRHFRKYFSITNIGEQNILDVISKGCQHGCGGMVGVPYQYHDPHVVVPYHIIMVLFPYGATSTIPPDQTIINIVLGFWLLLPLPYHAIVVQGHQKSEGRGQQD